MGPTTSQVMARRAGLSDLTRRFDISWFMGAIHKYRRLLGEVLVASFFLQLFVLVSPLFFQVIIDKVLVHRTLSTLDVLVIGLVSISVFEAILGGPAAARSARQELSRRGLLATTTGGPGRPRFVVKRPIGRGADGKPVREYVVAVSAPIRQAAKHE